MLDADGETVALETLAEAVQKATPAFETFAVAATLVR